VTEFLRLSGVYPSWRGRPGPRLAAAGVLAAAAMLGAGCAAKPASMSPQQAVDAAARQAGHISSATATLTEDVGGSTGETISGRVVEQLKPALLLSMTLNIGIGGAPGETLGGIITGKAMYLHSSAFTKAAGKPWIEIPFSILGGANSSLAQLFKSLSKINPAQQVEVFAGARNVRDAGTQVVNGVSTTHYAGSIAPSAGLAALPSGLRKALAPGLKAIAGDIRFNLWIDGQHQIIKALDTETVNGQTVTTTVMFSAINQPVHITLPPTSQVATIPAGALGSNTA
jgi:hypothetical protein